MKAILAKHRPQGKTQEQFTKEWEAAGDILEPLYKAICEIKRENIKMKASDFDVPNHYAKLAYQGGKLEILELIEDLLPDSVKE